ncbi:DUF402 domain-containing protein [Bacillus sp. NEB1478]|uniref:DUF402 domain-containing protein n=1 Tax=Bacillus sp. NEB1478 TaxID=3073816 RepID=UPI002872E235|nr:DUF402 domain-containing protein [Bacillus sp. NEB1478]WNB90806.1 DUF402 domain-containing protein [Bacillus sp. NEB1478]
MEHKTADRPNWKRVIERSFEVVDREDSCFKGKVTAIHLKKVSDPLVVNYKDRDVRIADTGYTWFQHFPEGKKYAVTTILDQNGEIVQWYIDMCRDHGVNEDGVPWYLDLYLDIVILPDNQIFVLDDNELMDAYRKGDITEKEVKLAKETAEDIINNFNDGKFLDLDVCKKHASEWHCEKKFL